MASKREDSKTLTFHYDVSLFNGEGYFDVLVPTATLARAQEISGWWPWKSTIEKRDTSTRKCHSVAVTLERGRESMTLWVWNNQLAARLCGVWESLKRNNRASFRDYTLSCLCGGVVMIGGSSRCLVCEKCGKYPRFKQYKGPWNPPGFHKLTKDETKPAKTEMKPAKTETCEIQVVNRHEADFTVYIGRGTPYGNPFKAADLGRKEALAQYERYARQSLMKAIAKLPSDAILGCSCKPKACHGDIIVKLWKEIHGQTPQKKSPGKKPKSPGSWQSLL